MGRPEIPVRRLEFVIPQGMTVAAVRIESGERVSVGQASALREASPWVSGEGETAVMPPVQAKDSSISPPEKRESSKRAMAVPAEGPSTGWSLSNKHLFQADIL